MALRKRVTASPMAAMRRSIRTPQHPFYVQNPPFCIQPFFIAPVLPGETMKRLNLQARVVTDPIKNKLIGWHVEYYFFYVKLRDLRLRDDLTQMLLDPSKSITGIDDDGVANVKDFQPAGIGMLPYVRWCTERVVTEYFRDEGDDYTTFTVAGASQTWPVAQINQNNPFDSAFQASEETAQDVTITVGVDDQITASEMDTAKRQWELLRAHNLTQMSYEDYLATFGVRVPAEELHRPELMRYIREWSYPTNTVEPSTGVPTSAVSWTVQEQADKDRMFREPGFLFGVTVTRPKVYLRFHQGSFTSAMNNTLSWMPAFLQSDPNARRRLLADNIGPFQNGNDSGYWVDMADLFLYGEQYVNIALTGTGENMMPLPIASLANKRYPPTMAAIAELFVGGTEATSQVRQDGIVSLSVATSLKDLSPRGGPLTNVA